MLFPNISARRFAAAIILAMAPLIALAQAKDKPPASAPAPEKSAMSASELTNDTCVGCHGNEGFSVPGADGKPRNLHVIADKFGKSVHGKRLCVECHKNITAIPHEPGTEVKVSCVECHESQWKSAQARGPRQGSGAAWAGWCR